MERVGQPRAADDRVPVPLQVLGLVAEGAGLAAVQVEGAGHQGGPGAVVRPPPAGKAGLGAGCFGPASSPSVLGGLRRPEPKLPTSPWPLPRRKSRKLTPWYSQDW